MFSLITLSLFAILMLWAAYSDLTSYTLSNRLCLAVALLYPLYLLALYLEGNVLIWSDILMTVGFAAVLFIIGAILFAFNVMGGGDVKLIPAVALWAGTGHILNYLFITALIGGAIAAIIIVHKHIKASKYFKSSENINLPMAEKDDSAVPYGAGIAGGGLYVAYQLLPSMT